jgi:competence protein ComEC
MRLAALSFTTGACLLQWQPRLPSPLQCAALLAGMVIATTLWWLAQRAPASRVTRVTATAMVIIAILTAGFLWAAALAHWRMDDALDPAWEGRDITVSGVISGLPQPFDRGVRFDFDVEAVAPLQAIVPKRISLAWYNGLTPDEFQEVQPVRAGERWRFTVRLRRPHGSANPHGFDFEAWMLENRLRATGTVAPRGERTRIDELARQPDYLLQRLREVIRERFWDLLPGERYAGVLTALAIGDQRAIEPDEWQVFARTGISHLMSISGLHVTMVSGLFAALLLWLWRRLSFGGRALALRLPAQKAAALAAALGALLYCLLSGFAVPAQRTLYMVCAMALALWFDRAGSATRVLAVALLTVVVLDPWAVLSPGFWLSFGAVALIFYVVTGRTQAEQGSVRHTLAQWATVQWAVTVGLAPLTLMLFGQVSLASPLANAIAIPLVSGVITPLALAGAVMPVDAVAGALLGVARWLLDLMMLLMNWLAAFDGAVWQQHSPALWTLPLALAGILWLLAPRGVPARGLGVLMLMPLFAVTPPAPGPGTLSLAVLDVGQGLAVVARTQQHALLFDAGPRWNPQADSGSRVVLPYLRGEGIDRLDMLVVSHDDNDHSGGAATVLAGVSVGQLLSSLDSPAFIADSAQRSLVPYRLPCRAGGRWSWDGVDFEWLHPSDAELRDAWIAPNERSCVLRIDAPGGSVLITGDIEKGAERVLLARGARLDADILLVPHHGSGTSSTPAFVQAVSPRHAVFTVGYRNRFGHPKREVWERYAGPPQRWRSDRDGAVVFTVGPTDAADGGGIRVSARRDSERRYWQAARD